MYLEEYRNINYTAFSKILKKYEKNTLHTTKGIMQNIKNTYCFSNLQLKYLITNAEYLFIRELYGGKRKKAMNEVYFTVYY